MTSTSEGPAGMSMEIMASLLDSSIFAAVTYWLPGPKILSTYGAMEQIIAQQTAVLHATVQALREDMRGIAHAAAKCRLQPVKL